MNKSKSSCKTYLYVRWKYEFLFLHFIVAMMEVDFVSKIGDQEQDEENITFLLLWS